MRRRWLNVKGTNKFGDQSYSRNLLTTDGSVDTGKELRLKQHCQVWESMPGA